jgi:hypothetical protein
MRTDNRWTHLLGAALLAAECFGADARAQHGQLPARAPDLSASHAAQASPVTLGAPQCVYAEPVPGPLPQEAPHPLAQPPAIAQGGRGDCGPCDGKDEAKEPPSPWAKVPPVRPMSLLGMFLIQPSGPGYYSLWDLATNNYAEEAPPRHGYPRLGGISYSFFDADFRYLDSPDSQDRDLFDPLKRIHLGDDFLFSTGGEFRFRYDNEVDSRLSGKDNTYELTRTRVYGDLWYHDVFRVYAEYIDAQTFNQDLVPLPIDHNHGDLLNLFADLKLGELFENPLYLRAGRQELLYGSQRLISPLDWANTRRTFQGAKLFYRGQDVDADAFVVQPVVPNPDRFDSVDDQVVFSGAWLTYHGTGRREVDFYYLDLDQARHVALGRGGQPGAFNVSTLGTRWLGDWGNLLYDFECIVQWGPYSNQDTLAEATTAGLGYYFKDLPTTPQVWAYYDFASGDPRPGQGDTHRTFNQLFPFGHYYFGYIDVVGRQNIEDVNFQLSFFPTKSVTALVQYHVLRLADARDALYNAAGVPIRRDPTGRAGTDVGDEIDVGTNFHLATHQDLYLSYSHLYAGEFIQRTGSPRSPDYLYLQYSVRW